MKNVVFISPHFPPGWYRFCERLRWAGARVLGIVDSPEIAPGVAAVLDAWAFVPNPGDLDQTLAVIRGWEARFGPIHRIDSLNEHWLGVEASLRAALGVFGQTPAELAVNRSKIGMKRRMIEAGVPTAPGEPVVSVDQVRAFAARVGYPIFFKPDVGVGASGAFPVASEAEVPAALARLDGPYLVEAFVRGEVVSFDGLADRDGRVVFSVAHVNCAGVLECRTQRLQTWYHSLRTMPPALEAVGTRMVEAFGVRERFFHIEFFRLPDEVYLAIEINVRPPGGFTVDMMDFSCDVDLYDWWARLILGQPTPTSFERRYACAHVSRRFEHRYKYPHEAVLARLGPALAHFGPVPAAFAEGMGDLAYLVRRPDEARLREDIAFIQALA